MKKSFVRKFTCLMFVTVILTLCACNKDTTHERDAEERRHGYNFRNIARSSEGIFYVKDNMVHFFSAANGEDMLLCFDPACKHEPASKLNPDPECTAALFERRTRIAYYEDSLYYLVNDGFFDMKIYRMDISGGTREHIADVPYNTAPVVTVIFEGDYMYYITEIVEIEADEESIVGTAKNSSEIMEVNLTDGSWRLVTDGCGTCYSSFKELDVYGRTLYAEVYPLDTWNESVFDIIVNLDTLEMTVVDGEEFKERKYIGPYDGESYYYVNRLTHEVGIYDMTEDKSEVLFKIEADLYSSLMASDREVFYKTGFDGVYEYYLYDVMEDECHDITDGCEGKHISFYDGYSDIFVGYATEENDEHEIKGYTAYSLTDMLGR